MTKFGFLVFSQLRLFPLPVKAALAFRDDAFGAELGCLLEYDRASAAITSLNSIPPASATSRASASRRASSGRSALPQHQYK